MKGRRVRSNGLSTGLRNVCEFPWVSCAGVDFLGNVFSRLERIDKIEDA